MDPILRSWVSKILRFIFVDIFGFSFDLMDQLPHGWDHYAEYLHEEWLPTTKGKVCRALWWIIAVISFIAWVRGHYGEGIVIFLGGIRLSAFMCNWAMRDYLKSLTQNR